MWRSVGKSEVSSANGQNMIVAFILESTSRHDTDAHTLCSTEMLGVPIGPDGLRICGAL